MAARPGFGGFYDGADAHLKPKEVQLLKLPVDHPNIVWSRQAIAMKNLKLFPKTFLVSIDLFVVLIILVHALVYALMSHFIYSKKSTRRRCSFLS